VSEPRISPYFRPPFLTAPQLTVWLIMLLLGAFPNTDLLVGRAAIGTTIGLLLLFGTAVSGFAYLLAFLFTSAAEAQIFTIFVVLVLGVVLSIVGYDISWLAGRT
jgi:hypothetical protein